MNPQFSVVIPMYNGEKTIERCLSSLLPKTQEADTQIILCDDGSSDRSIEIASRFESQFADFRILHLSHGGASRARNAGIREAAGDFILFADCDDELLPGALKTLLPLAKQYDCVAFDCKTVNTEAGEEKDNCSFEDNKFFSKSEIVEQIFRPIFHGKLISLRSPCNKVFKREILEKNAISFPEDAVVGEDAIFCYRYFDACETLYYLKKSFYIYYVNSFTNSAKYGKKLAPSLIAEFSCMETLAEKNEVDLSQDPCFILWFLKRLLLFVLSSPKEALDFSAFDHPYVQKQMKKLPSIPHDVRLSFDFYEKESDCYEKIRRRRFGNLQNIYFLPSSASKKQIRIANLKNRLKKLIQK